MKIKRMELPEYDDNDLNSTSPEPDSKRRRLRKGTRSCWNCKRRKVKCTFKSATDDVCIACHHRGTGCVGQERPEEESHAEDTRGLLFERVVRVEALLEDLVSKVGQSVIRDGNSAGLDPSGKPISKVISSLGAPRSMESFVLLERPFQQHKEPPACEPSLTSTESPTVTTGVVVPEASTCTKISQALLNAFPSQEDINLLCKSDYEATFYFHHVITKEDSGPDHEAFDFVNDLAKIPNPSTHPVLIAKRMLILASFLQFFPPQQVVGLVEQAPVVMKRLTEASIRLVTTNEEMVGCLEGLECIILEGVFQSNIGNLRRAWLAFRRAMVTAQLMRMDRHNPPPVKTLDLKTRMNPAFMWFRIVYMDRFLSLMLGLPQGSPDQNVNLEVSGETPTSKLERLHTMIAGRIIERNKRDPLLWDLSITQELDAELLNVAKGLPDKFWLPPNFANMRRNTREAFWEQMRLADQIHHYNLVHLLHLPYLIRCDQGNYHEYSKITCVNASREILSRFIAFRSFNSVTSCCRTADFFALMAGMTILLAHIDSHRQCKQNLLAHQRLGDRAMVEQVLENMEQVTKLTGDILTAKSSHLLRRLLQVENEAVQGKAYTADTALSCLEEECSVIQLPIPYFGMIKIGREGIISKDLLAQQILRPLRFDESPDSVHVANHVFSFGSGAIPHPNSYATHSLPALDRQQVPSEVEAQVVVASEDDSVRRQQALHPSLTAGVNDWAFQGVDAAFFDSLMRGT